MVGITSYGAYVPIHRISRSEIAKFWGAPAGPGEKAVANYDEDSLTMAFAAAVDCLKGIDRQGIDRLYFASTTSPYKEKQAAALIATVLGMGKATLTIDFAGSLRAGSNALTAAVDAVASGTAKNVLVCAADMRLGYPMGQAEVNFGDGAAAILIGDRNIAAQIEGSHSVLDEIQDIWRSDRDTFVRSAEDRFIQDEGYLKITAEAVSAILEKNKLTPKDLARVAIYSTNSRQLQTIVRKLGFDPKTQVTDILGTSVGDTGAAMSLMSLVANLEEARAGDRILLISYSNGCDVSILKVTPEIEKLKDRRGIKKHLASKRMLGGYNKYLRFREMITVQPAARPSLDFRQPSPAAQHRENDGELRLRGTKCKNCGTRQYPPQRVCMVCRKKDEMEWYAFSDKKARVASFSHDYVMETVDPPVTVTMVDFDGGGRIMCDMTDRDPEAIKVGMPVEMTFRRLYYVGGIYNYWWKCQPVRC
jgi:hydroxymethylglutaryl-CoA synthase